MDIEPIKDIKELKEAISEIQKMESKNGKKAESRRWWIPIAQGILDAYKLKQAKGRAEDMDIESAEERWWKPIAHTVISLLGRAGDAAEENEEENFMDIEPIKDMKELKEAVSEIQKMESKNGKKVESRRWWIPIAKGVLTALGRSADVDKIVDVTENRENNMLAIQPIHNKKELDVALKLIQKMESNQDRNLAESRRWWIPIVNCGIGRSRETDELAEERRWWLPIAQGLLDAYKLKSAKGRAVDDAEDNEEENFMDIEPIKDINELKEAISEIQKMESKNGKKAESRRWWIPIAQGVLTALG